MWVEAFWTCLRNVFQVFETMCCRFFREESTLFAIGARFSVLFEGILVAFLGGIRRWWFLCWPVKIWCLCCLQYSPFMQFCTLFYSTCTLRSSFAIHKHYKRFSLTICKYEFVATWTVNYRLRVLYNYASSCIPYQLEELFRLGRIQDNWIF